MRRVKRTVLSLFLVIAMLCPTLQAAAEGSVPEDSEALVSTESAESTEAGEARAEKNAGEPEESADAVIELYHAEPAEAHLIINQVYGGGGKGDTPISNSFVEIYNSTDGPVDLKDYTLVYGSSSLALSYVSLAAGGSWLVVGAAEETTEEFLTYELPEADQTWDGVTISNKNYTIELKKGDDLVDSVTADENVQAVKASKQKSLRRIKYQDTDTNDDFEIVVWEKTEVTVDEAYVEKYAPRNSKGETGAVYGAPSSEPEPAYTPVQASSEKVSGNNNGNSTLDMELYARHNSGAMNADGGSLEIVEYNEVNGYAYAVSGLKGKIIAVEIANVPNGSAVADLAGIEYDVKSLVTGAQAPAGFSYGDITSVAVSPDGTRLAAAVQHETYDKNGVVAVFECSSDGSLKNPVLYETGVQPDMVVFADNDTVLTADEGEPRNGYGNGAVDPAGTVSVIRLLAGISVQAGFEGFSADELLARNIILGIAEGQVLSPAADLEPEYIAVSSDGKTAYVSLQEANAIAVFDVAAARFTGIYSAGYEDYSKVAVDLVEDDGYHASTYENLVGARMPDGISIYEGNGKTWILSANEGDSREWNDYLNEAKTKDFTGKSIKILDPACAAGLPEGKSVMFGGRGFTIYEVTSEGLTEVYDSGSGFEALTAEYLPDYFNCSNDDIEIDSRSTKKGPEPENVTVGKVNGRAYAFIALERIGGIMVYDITDPENTSFVNYINSREYDSDIQGDVSPEGLCFAASVNGTGNPVLLAACEVSGTLAVYELKANENDSNGEKEPEESSEPDPDKENDGQPDAETETGDGSQTDTGTGTGDGSQTGMGTQTGNNSQAGKGVATGDNSRTVMYAAMTLLGICGMSAVFLDKRRKKNTVK